MQRPLLRVSLRDSDSVILIRDSVALSGRIELNRRTEFSRRIELKRRTEYTNI